MSTQTSSSGHAAELTVPARFRGPARSGNGGYTAGSLAELVPAVADVPVIEVTLRRPPPLDVLMSVELADEPPAAVLTWQGETVAQAREVDAELTAVDEVAADDAEKAMGRYRGLHGHPFPGCFACGTERGVGDGLRIFPGEVAEHTVASLWVPDESLAVAGDLVDPGIERVGVATTWAALDCVGGWSDDLEGRPMVLGRITARVDALPVVGEPHVVVGRRTSVEGRKSFTSSTLYDSDGRVVASAEHVWIVVDPAIFN
jgi:hypothetical protein